MWPSRFFLLPSPPSSAAIFLPSPPSRIALLYRAILRNNSSSDRIDSRVPKETIWNEISPFRTGLPFSFALHSYATSSSVDPPSLSAAIAAPLSPSLSWWNLDRMHILLLNFSACAVAISAAWLFFSAIPTLLAFKTAAEYLVKQLDVTAEELPDTMAAVRLCGMEMSDLVMELSDLGMPLISPLLKILGYEFQQYESKEILWTPEHIWDVWLMNFLLFCP